MEKRMAHKEVAKKVAEGETELMIAGIRTRGGENETNPEDEQEA